MRMWISSSRFLMLLFSGCWLDPGPRQPVSACGLCRGCVFSSADFIRVLTGSAVRAPRSWRLPSSLAGPRPCAHARTGSASGSGTGLHHLRTLPPAAVLAGLATARAGVQGRTPCHRLRYFLVCSVGGESIFAPHDQL